MKVVAFVPIKLNSERLENKNILSFDNGKNLSSYIQNTLLQVENIDEIYVYCSDTKIKDYIIEGIKFLPRSSHLDLSTTPFMEVIASFVKQIEADYYVLTHTTAPFIKSESIYKGIEMVKSGQYDSALGVQRINEFLWENNKPLNYSLDNIPRTQDLPLMYAETCGLYIFPRDLVVKKNRRVGDNPYLIELSKIESIDINDKEDFIIANAIASLIEV